MKSICCIALALVSAGAAWAANTNAQGITLHLGTADYGSGTVDGNATETKNAYITVTGAGVPTAGPAGLARKNHILGIREAVPGIK